MILLKGYDSNGFRFFTNYSSRKGKDLVLMLFVAIRMLAVGYMTGN